MRAVPGLIVAAVAAAALGGCEFGKTTVPEGRSRPVVHAVLNPSRRDQLVLVERTLTGRLTIDTGVLFDRRDPIATGRGDPISGAEVVITSLETGDSAYAVEATTLSPQGRGRGVYLFLNDPQGADGPVAPVGRDVSLPVAPGARYRLRVRTPDGEVTGEATVPAVRETDGRRRTDTLNVDRDTLVVAWDPAGAASRYSLRIETPYGPFFFFTDSVQFRLSGQLRNLFADRLPTVFVPGFRQTVQVAAVDTNFFDYYRSGNNPFTGTGIINRLSGGTGLFGAYAPVDTRSVEVTANEDEPIEGLYTRAVAPGREDSLQLYVSSRLRDGVALSGSFRTPGARTYVIGQLEGTRITIARLREQSVGDTVGGTFQGTAEGASIVFDATEFGVPATFRKVPR